MLHGRHVANVRALIGIFQQNLRSPYDKHYKWQHRSKSKKEPVLTPGSEKSPEQLRLEKEKNDQSANNNPKSDSKVDNEVEKKA